MDKKQYPQDSPKGSVTTEQAKKLDELAEKINRLPESRKEMIKNLMKKKLLNSKEVCEILGVSLATLRRWVAKKKIKFVKVSRFIRFPSEEVFSLVENQSALNVPEVAELLCVGLQAVRKMIERGEIKAFRMSKLGHYRIKRSEVERFLKGDG